MPKNLHLLVFDRSNPHAVICTDSEGKSRTRLEEMNSGKFCRRDLAMVNVCEGHKVTDQLCIYGNKDGTLYGESNVLSLITDSERKEIQDIVNKIMEVGETYPAMLKLLQ